MRSTRDTLSSDDVQAFSSSEHGCHAYHPRYTNVLPYSSINGQYVEEAFVEAAKELKDKFVLVAPDKFLDAYLPEHPDNMPKIDRDAFMKVAFIMNTREQKWVKKSMESYMYGPLVHLSLVLECIYVLILNR
jgi:hypothetical protein